MPNLPTFVVSACNTLGVLSRSGNPYQTTIDPPTILDLLTKNGLYATYSLQGTLLSNNGINQRQVSGALLPIKVFDSWSDQLVDGACTGLHGGALGHRPCQGSRQ